ncbi:MAG: cytidylate kinase [Spartobacteria bacterium]|nr:cytidylate kinase [Spartobacteria bacterium]
MRSDSHCVIAIDGPAASGKSSVARELARRLGFVYVNSGAMYRAITWYILDNGIDASDDARIAAFLENAALKSEIVDHASRILIDDLDPTKHLRDAHVNNGVSRVSAVRRVREILDEKMHDYARDHNLVVEGRDIGSVVFPRSPYKFYIDASPDVRARRRAAEGQRDEIAARDRADSSRTAAPLIIAEDALVIDSSHLTIDGVVGEIIGQLKLKGLPIPA